MQQNKNTESRTAATQITVFIHEHISESVLFLDGWRDISLVLAKSVPKRRKTGGVNCFHNSSQTLKRFLLNSSGIQMISSFLFFLFFVLTHTFWHALAHEKAERFDNLELKPDWFTSNYAEPLSAARFIYLFIKYVSV